MKKPIIFLLIFFSLLFLGNIYFIFAPSIYEENGAIFYLPPNMSKQAVMATLTQQQYIPHSWVGYQALFLQKFLVNSRIQFKTGEYVFKPRSSPFSIMKQITQGRGLTAYRFTIVPGWTFQQLRHALTNTDKLRHVVNTLSDRQIMATLNSPDLPEGWFFPDTYYYTRDMKDIIILKKAFDLMQAKLKTAWPTRQSQLPYQNEYEALIAASLIEKEAYWNKERALIAGVIVNRLRRNMLLQIDPTIIYGMGKTYQAKILQTDLQKDTVYNTYLHKGLPPTPIAMPSFASIDAALHPAEHDYLYFVATGNGFHQFSSTLNEHHMAVNNRAIKDYFFNTRKIKLFILSSLPSLSLFE